MFSRQLCPEGKRMWLVEVNLLLLLSDMEGHAGRLASWQILGGCGSGTGLHANQTERQEVPSRFCRCQSGVLGRNTEGWSTLEDILVCVHGQRTEVCMIGVGGTSTSLLKRISPFLRYKPIPTGSRQPTPSICTQQMNRDEWETWWDPSFCGVLMISHRINLSK